MAALKPLEDKVLAPKTTYLEGGKLEAWPGFLPVCKTLPHWLESEIGMFQPRSYSLHPWRGGGGSFGGVELERPRTKAKCVGVRSISRVCENLGVGPHFHLQIHLGPPKYTPGILSNLVWSAQKV